MKIVFRVNGGERIGLGHLMRCISLAEAFLRFGISITFLSNEESKEYIQQKGFDYTQSDSFDLDGIGVLERLNPDIVIIDTYQASPKFIEVLANKFFLVQFDDNNDIYGETVAQALINGNLHAKDLNYISKHNNTTFLLGLEYLVMKKEYWDVAKTQTKGNGLLVTTGGADYLDLMPQFIQVLMQLPMKKRIVIGPAFTDSQIVQVYRMTLNDVDFEIIDKPSSLKPFIEDSQIVITASGSTIYEVLALRKVPIIYTTALNQCKAADRLESQGVFNLGWHENLQFSKIRENVMIARNHISAYESKLTPLFLMFDGKGAIRVAEKLLSKVQVK